MIVLYTSPGCSSCRKVKQWLKDHDLEYTEKNIFKTLLDKEEIKYLLSRSENGTDDLISRRSKIIQEGKINLDEMSLNDLVDFIQANPSILRRPIILSSKVLQIGYDEEEIDAFIPHELRRLAALSCHHRCPNYTSCGQVRQETSETLEAPEA